MTNIYTFPIDTLRIPMLSYIRTSLPSFHDELKDAINWRNLDNSFVYTYTNTKITESAEICRLPSGKIQIIFYDNYLQYLWCICYSFIVFYDQHYKKCKKLDYDEKEFNKGLMVFNAGLTLFDKHNTELFFSLPNPTIIENSEPYYISKASAIFLESFCFILCHEFGHHFLDHFSYEYQDYSLNQYKKQELDADCYAIKTFIENFTSENELNKKCGIIAALSSFLFFDNEKMCGGDHPDPDVRIKNALTNLNLKSNDELWDWATIFFSVWSIYYHDTPIKNNRNLESTLLDFEYVFESCQKWKCI